MLGVAWKLAGGFGLIRKSQSARASPHWRVFLPSKVAIVGFGSSGNRFLALAKGASPAPDLLVVTTQNPELSGVEIANNLAALAVFGPDVVVLTGPASTRISVAKMVPAETAGVFLEKPMEVNVAAGSELSVLLESTSRVTQVGYNLRFSESLTKFRSMVRGREYGSVLSVRAETGQYLPSWRPGRDYRGAVSANAALGGGVLLELSHEWDYLRWVFGDTKWVRAWFGKASSLDIDVEDSAHVTMGFEGAEGAELVAQVNLDFLRHDRGRTVTAICQQGTLRWDGVAGHVEVFLEGAEQWQSVFRDSGKETTYEAQWMSFIHAVHTGSEPMVTLADGLEVLRVIEAVRLSHKNGGQQVAVDRSGALL